MLGELVAGSPSSHACQASPESKRKFAGCRQKPQSARATVSGGFCIELD